MKQTLTFSLLFAALVFACSCSKNIARPSNQIQSASTADAKTAPVVVTPGNYTVPLYVNDGDTSTKSFMGYVFTFNSNGTLNATADSVLYKGKWELKNNGKEMKIDIDGTPALHQIKKNWNVVLITTAAINLNAPEHGKPGRDVLNFSKVQ